MSEIDKFNANVRQLEHSLTALAALADRTSPPAEEALVAARWEIVRKLAEIAAFDEKFVLAPLEAKGDPDLIAQAAALGSAMQALMRQLMDHSQRWTARAVRDDWQGFRRALPAIHQLIRDHYLWETQVVPPLLAVLEGVSATPKRNWTRGVWAVQDAFKK